MIKIILIFSFLLISCAQVTSLNLKRHQFGRVPTKIIWMQIAGLNTEHLTLIKYDKKADYKTSFENSLCIGNTWDYNLFQLRMNAEDSFLSQITNRENIKGECSDFDNKPIWRLLASKSYTSAILESPSSSSQSILKANTCEKEEFLKDATIFKMEKNPKLRGKNLFHFSERLKGSLKETLYDRSCIEGNCSDSFNKNAIAISEKYIGSDKNSLLIIRDFTYLEAIKQKRFDRAKEVLEKLDELNRFFQEKSKQDPSTLLIVTSAESKNIDFPKSGKEWKEFIEKNKNIVNRNTQLISPVFVTGARGENFCSMYKQSEVLERMFIGAKKQDLELIMLNPFGN